MQVTPELLNWLDSQRHAGFDDEVLRKALVDVGYTDAFARGFLAGAPGAQGAPAGVESSANTAKSSGLSSSSHPAQSASHSQGVQPALAANGIASSPASLAWFGQQSICRSVDVDVGVLLQMKHPQLAVFEGLLTPSECDELIELARPRLSSSLTVDSDSGNSVQHTARVSSGMFFQRGENPLVQRLEARMSALLGFPESHGEGLQILNYLPGGKYDPHQDYFDPAHPGSHVHLARGGQRIATLIVYLNTPQSGGSTVFPDVGLTVSAMRGRAVYFSYPQAHASSACLHGGNPVIEGEKWIATKWVRQSVFK